MELREHPRAAGPVGERVGEPTADPLGHARAQQEVADDRALEGEDLAAQVVGDGVVVAGEVGQEAVGIRFGLQGQRGEPQAGGPALGPLQQPRELLGAQGDAVLGEQRRGLVRGERQIGEAQLAQAALDAQPPEREIGIAAAGDDQPEAGAALRGQRGDERARRAAQQMGVVEDEDHAPRRAQQRRPQLEGDVRRERCRRLRLGRERHPGGRQRRRELAPQAADIEVLGPERQPRDAAAGRPFGEEDGLARARGAGDDRQGAAAGAVERLLQAPARDPRRGRDASRPRGLNRSGTGRGRMGHPATVAAAQALRQWRERESLQEGAHAAATGARTNRKGADRAIRGARPRRVRTGRRARPTRGG